MINLKKTMLRLFFTLEMIAFTGVYLFGAQGVYQIWRLKKDIDGIQAEIDDLSGQTTELNDRIVAWHNHCYYKEKIAREQLQMARATDEVYYIG